MNRKIRTWVEISLNDLEHNYREISSRLPDGCQMLGVCKANAYGHGAVRVAQRLQRAGCQWVAVNCYDEAEELRAAGVTMNILLLGPQSANIAVDLATLGVTQAVGSIEYARELNRFLAGTGLRLDAHMKLETGMGRTGFAVESEREMAGVRELLTLPGLEPTGVFTHFATADCPETLDFHIQAKRYIEAVEGLRAAGINPGIVHCANSAAAIRYPDVRFDMVRLGIGLYGYQPCPETTPLIELRPAMSVHARITDTRLVPMSEGVSYGLNYRSPGSVKICTVPVGYGDGLRRGLSSRTDFLVDGVRCRQVGNICMDQCMFEVDLRSYARRRRVDPQVGDEVLIVGQQGDAMVTIEEMCETLNTIPHELCIGFAQRMPRYYV